MLPVSSSPTGPHLSFDVPSELLTKLERHLTESLSYEERFLNFEPEFSSLLPDFNKYLEFVNSLFETYPNEICWPLILFHFPNAFAQTAHNRYSESHGKNAFSKIDPKKPSFIRRGQEATPEEVRIFVEKVAKICIAFVAENKKFHPRTELAQTISDLLYQTVCDTNTLHHVLDYLITDCPPAFFIPCVNIFAAYFDHDASNIYFSLVSERLHLVPFDPLKIKAWLDSPQEDAGVVGLRGINFKNFLWDGKLFSVDEMRGLIIALKSEDVEGTILSLFSTSSKSSCLLNLCPELFNPVDVLTFLAAGSFTPTDKLKKLQYLLSSYSSTGVNALNFVLENPNLVEYFQSIMSFDNCLEVLAETVSSFNWELLSHLKPEMVVPLFIAEAKRTPSIVMLSILIKYAPKSCIDPALSVLASDEKYIKKIKSCSRFLNNYFSSAPLGSESLFICKKLFSNWENILISLLDIEAAKLSKNKSKYGSYGPNYCAPIMSIVETFKALQIMDAWIEKDFSMFSEPAQVVLRDSVDRLQDDRNNIF